MGLARWLSQSSWSIWRGRAARRRLARIVAATAVRKHLLDRYYTPQVVSEAERLSALAIDTYLAELGRRAR